MNDEQSINDLSLEDFINRPDTIALVARDGFLANEDFRSAHGIRAGTHLSADQRQR